MDTLKDALYKAEISKVADRIAILNHASSHYELQEVHALLEDIPDYCDHLLTQIKDGVPGTLRPKSAATYLLKFQSLLELPCVKGLLQLSPTQQQQLVQQLERCKSAFYTLRAQSAAKQAADGPTRRVPTEPVAAAAAAGGNAAATRQRKRRQSLPLRKRPAPRWV